ncbi:endonuclease/exonuclease/phosphatase family protein [Bacteroides sp.]|uniref:endonuclease/exonuclease/phosphatase family protein n=1 Tax=Bacteroides sp. TaxID=29523 RepID=UPI00262E72EA|nr:endonuclease/exonuclease/phosphatase family protein [Bacteroides sp.]MDD3038485.1 endonuclease/exonuclease/phosphatase family protein [Bacteroides sp.]
MKNRTSLFVILLSIVCYACSDSKDSTDNTVVGQLSVYLKDTSGKPVKDAFVVMSGLEKNRVVTMGEGRSDENGKWLPYYKGSVDGYISIVSPKYEPHKERISYDGKYETKLEIILKPAQTVSVLSYNVLNGFDGKDTKKQRFLNWMTTYDPDIMLFQELNNFTEASLLEFAKQYGHEYAYITKETGYPTGLTSRYPITNVEKVLRGSDPTIYTYHGFIHAKCQGIDIFVIHLSPFELKDRVTEIKNIMNEKIKKLPAEAKIMVAGDFNSYNAYDAKAYGPKFESERLNFSSTTAYNFEVTDFLLENGFKDAFTLYSNGHFKQSIPVSTTEFPENKGCRYDYIMLNGNLANDCTYSDILREKTTNVLSDHYPNYIRLNLK